ncbi:MAG: HAD family phosphatase [Verrucomicrobiota bacterium]|nr:HAD family phosphatase [Verrucomicrobiota bacterium]
MSAHAVIFDLGNVLLHFDYSRAAEKIAKNCSIPEQELLQHLNQSPLLHRFETGHITAEEFFNEIRVASCYSGTFETFATEFGDIFWPAEEMIALNEQLQSEGIPTYIFSNTSPLAVEHIREQYPFFRHFSGYVLSYEHKAMKPAAAIYEVVESVTGKSGSQLIYIDDRVENTDAGALRGWNVILHKSPALTIPQVRALLG